MSTLKSAATTGPTRQHPVPRTLSLAALTVLAVSCAEAAQLGNAEDDRHLGTDAEALSAIPQHATRALCGLAPPGSARCHAQVRVRPDGERLAMSAPSGLGPKDLKASYNIPDGGKGVTVAIVDAQDSPTAEKDLAVYRKHFGLPPCTTDNGCFKKVNQNGKASPLPAADSGWAGEIALDLDMVSAVCPACSILLVEANTASMDDLGTGVNAAVALGAKVVSNSYGGAEDSTVSDADSKYFNHPGTLIFVSSGDDGFGTSYPASSAYVIGVGGTSLTKSGSARGWAEKAWTGGGSGCSAFVPKPGFQGDNGCGHRTVTDIAAVADPNTGVAVFSSDGGSSGSSGWMVVGGTSASAPIVAALFAAAGKTDVGTSWPYAHASAFHDIVSGNNGTCDVSYLCNAGPGYDGPTGVGSPNGAAMAAANNASSGEGTDPVPLPSSGGDPPSGSSSSSGGPAPAPGGSCGHDLCSSGEKVLPTCDPCAQKVCDVDDYCCDTKWDADCVAEARELCGKCK